MPDKINFIAGNHVDGVLPQVDERMRKVNLHRSILAVMSRVYEEKNQRYGDSFGRTYRDLGIVSAVTRMTDKMNRVTQLALAKAEASDDESLKDTLLDLANYAVMTIMEMEEK